MFRYQQDYQKVEELRKKHPRKRTSDLLALAKVSGGSYYRGRREALDAKAPIAAKKRHTVLKAATPPQSGDERMVFLMGTPEQIRSVMAGGAL